MDTQQAILETLREILDRLTPTTGTRVTCAKPSILDEEWWLDDGGAIVYDHPDYGSPRPVELHHFKRELSALPDCLRVLVMVQARIEYNSCRTDWDSKSYHDIEKVVTAALEKAGVE